MFEKFNDPEKAAMYVSTGLAKDYPNATMEIIHVVKNRPRRSTCKTSEAFPILARACQRFPYMSVEYHPENPYGFVAEIRCHGEQRHGHTRFRMHTTDRPRVLVLLTTVDGQDVTVGSYQAPTENFPSAE